MDRDEDYVAARLGRRALHRKVERAKWAGDELHLAGIHSAAKAAASRRTPRKTKSKPKTQVQKRYLGHPGGGLIGRGGEVFEAVDFPFGEWAEFAGGNVAG